MSQGRNWKSRPPAALCTHSFYWAGRPSQESGVRELPAEPCTASLTTLHWEPCRPDSLAGAAGAAPQAWDLVARLPGIRHAHRLEELYLGGDVEGPDLERGAALLFDELPALGKVCAPQGGLSFLRHKVAA